MLKPFLKVLIEKEYLTQEEAYLAMTTILEGKATPSQLSSFISILSFRGIKTHELTGLTQAMRDYGRTIPLKEGEPVVDTCGTGASGVKTFNVSTASAIVAASSGLKIAKHGNRSVTSQTGSADVLEELGIPVEQTTEQIQASFAQHSMCFMFAPIYHQAMKHASTTRKEIGFRSIFNLLGPLTNPAGAMRQVIGVFDPTYGKRMAETLQHLGSEHVLIVHGTDGLDEFTVSGETKVTELKAGSIKEYELRPEDVGLEVSAISDIRADSPQHSATMIREVLDGSRTDAAKDIVAYNAGAALYVGGKATNMREGVALAQSLIESGKAKEHLQHMVQERGAIKHA
ncbi:anthranilate phosphoribosyltransferase [Caldalkalibacillus salinus]|uniref:anthranilate phosphoribosyltransferase n=1 Tax=Caldalkalibacillus salinus TaxID=2803787 RepID=UPI00192466A6|nr:anthranilate phosphoribosyltransferase [Caldalkalibacillus salinus]